MASGRSRSKKIKAGMDRETLRAELVALYHQYRTDAEHAEQLKAEYDRMSKNVEVLLNEEFPGWKDRPSTGSS